MGDLPGPPAPLAGRPAAMTSAAAAAAAAPSPAAFFFFPAPSAWVSPSKSRLALSRPVDTGDPNAERPIAGVTGDATVSERIFSPTCATMDGVFACALVSSVFFSLSSAPPEGTEPGTETGLKPYALERRRRARSFPSPFFALAFVARTVVVAAAGAVDATVVGKTQSKHRLHDAA